MNFLAHLHIAYVTKSSFLGNFLGDFVKGDPDGRFNEETVHGIRLHRFIDSYTDQHTVIKRCKPLFPAPLRRFSPITLDMFWDHCLAKHWQQFHPSPLADFCLHAELQINKESIHELNPLPAQFKKISQLVWQDKWLQHYADINNIKFALQQIAKRTTRMAPLALTAQTLVEHYDFLQLQFFELYADLLLQASHYHEKGDR